MPPVPDLAEVVRLRAPSILAAWTAALAAGGTPVVKLIQAPDDPTRFDVSAQDLAALIERIPPSQSGLAAHLSAFAPDVSMVTILFILRPEPGVIEPNVIRVAPDQLEAFRVEDSRAMRLVPGAN